MKRVYIAICLCLGLSSCSLFQSNKNTGAPEMSYDNATRSANGTKLNSEQIHNLPAPQRTINFYVRGLMQDLIGNLQFVNERTPVAVTSFVLLDSHFNETNLLGNQIAESLIHEIHKFGIPVLDFKTSNEINVSEHGDFIFSREATKLNLDLPVHYVFAGTMVKHQGGYLINARVVGVNSKAVVASAQTFIPSEISNALIEQPKKQRSQTKKTISLEQKS